MYIHIHIHIYVYSCLCMFMFICIYICNMRHGGSSPSARCRAAARSCGTTGRGTGALRALELISASVALRKIWFNTYDIHTYIYIYIYICRIAIGTPLLCAGVVPVLSQAPRTSRASRASCQTASSRRPGGAAGRPPRCGDHIVVWYSIISILYIYIYIYVYIYIYICIGATPGSWRRSVCPSVSTRASRSTAGTSAEGYYTVRYYAIL